MPTNRVDASALRAEIVRSCPVGTDVTIGGAGDRWHCVAERGERYCSVAHSPEAHEAGYLCYFRIGAGVDASGRTLDRGDAVRAAALWIDGASVEVMREHFAFIDVRVRAVLSLAERIAALWPAGAEGVPEIEDDGISQYLEAETEDRSCNVRCDDMAADWAIELSWYGVVVMRAALADLKTLSLLVLRWIAEHRVPSAMHAEFPALTFRSAAAAFEAGRRTEGEFLASWDDIAEFCADPHYPMTEEFTRLIQHLRGEGLDRAVRAGSSHCTLIFSRASSYRPGARRGGRHG